MGPVLSACGLESFDLGITPNLAWPEDRAWVVESEVASTPHSSPVRTSAPAKRGAAAMQVDCHRRIDLKRGESVGRGRLVRSTLALAVCGSSTILAVMAPSSPAHADTSAYELYCPGTPVGTIVMNGTVTTGSLSPAKPSSGKTFSVANFQTTIVLPVQLVSASAALGNKVVSGTYKTAIDVTTGATPSSISTGSQTYKVTIPKPIPAKGLAVPTPSSPATVGKFKASSKTVSASLDQHVTFTLIVSGSPLTMKCTTYKNNTEPTGITTHKPKGTPISAALAHAG